jgi:hypothetical protein
LSLEGLGALFVARRRPDGFIIPVLLDDLIPLGLQLPSPLFHISTAFHKRKKKEAKKKENLLLPLPPSSPCYILLFTYKGA